MIFKKYFKELLLGLFIALFIITILQKIFIIATIHTESMYPTLKVHQRVLIKPQDNVQRSHIYAFKREGGYLIKRCIAVAGDHVEINNNQVILNGKLLQENYISSDCNDTLNLDLIVPENAVFFMGDNRAVSNDSRYWDNKFIDESDVLGEVTFSIIPFQKINEGE